MFDEDYVPSTIEAAINEMYSIFTDEEVQFLRVSSIPFERIHTRFMMKYGMAMRNAWSLWERGTPLKEDAKRLYQISHADDISSLIMAGALARMRCINFATFLPWWCERFHNHWAKAGLTSLEAGEPNVTD